MKTTNGNVLPSRNSRKPAIICSMPPKKMLAVLHRPQVSRETLFLSFHTAQGREAKGTGRRQTYVVAVPAPAEPLQPIKLTASGSSAIAKPMTPLHIHSHVSRGP